MMANEETAMMKGIDISHWQKYLNIAEIQYDFVICKATEGTNFLDSSFHGFMSKAESLGKCMGFYHFARPEKNTAEAEAKFFYANTVKYYGKAIPVLDWESKGKWNVAWAKEWLDLVYSMTGVKPMIYMSESVVNQFNWADVANADYGLWVAKYKDMNIDRNYDMSMAGNKPNVKWWKFYALWQWTSSGRLDGYNANLDCDVFYGDAEAWKRYAGTANEKTYMVKDGDTLSMIAKEHNQSVDELVERNNLIRTGQILKV